jgi:hypothetical protein
VRGVMRGCWQSEPPSGGHALPTMSGVRAVPTEAAVAALQTVLTLPWQEASIEAVNAVTYATRDHPEWFWRGAQHTENRCANVRNRRVPFAPDIHS